MPWHSGKLCLVVWLVGLGLTRLSCPSFHSFYQAVWIARWGRRLTLQGPNGVRASLARRQGATVACPKKEGGRERQPTSACMIILVCFWCVGLRHCHWWHWNAHSQIISTYVCQSLVLWEDCDIATEKIPQHLQTIYCRFLKADVQILSCEHIPSCIKICEPASNNHCVDKPLWPNIIAWQPRPTPIFPLVGVLWTREPSVAAFSWCLPCHLSCNPDDAETHNFAQCMNCWGSWGLFRANFLCFSI